MLRPHLNKLEFKNVCSKLKKINLKKLTSLTIGDVVFDELRLTATLDAVAISAATCGATSIGRGVVTVG